MTFNWSRAVAEIERRTPPDRDRLADFFRAVAIALVVLGHWLVVVLRERNGALVADRLLAVAPWTQWATWAFQVMPLFFFFGGFANARSWNDAVSHERWDDWVQRRAQRLLTPLAPLLAVWLLLVVGMRLAGSSVERIHLASQAALFPVWFLGIYLLVIAAVPLTWAIHRRWGGSAVAAFLVVVLAVDFLAGRGVPWVAAANSLIVWAAIHQCGYFWYDRSLPTSPAASVGLLLLGSASLVLLIGEFGYPVSMVTVGGDVRSNADPPTGGIFALFLAQLGVIIAVRRNLDRWLHRPRPWAIVATIARVTLTLYLWHMTALVLVVLALDASGLWRPPGFGPAWWRSRPAWLIFCGIVLAALVSVFHRFSTPRKLLSKTGSSRLVLGLAGVLLGIAWIVRHGLHDPDAPAYVSLLAVVSLSAGLAAVRAIPSLPRPRERRRARAL